MLREDCFKIIFTPSLSSTKFNSYSRKMVVKVKGFKYSARLDASIS